MMKWLSLLASLHLVAVQAAPLPDPVRMLWTRNANLEISKGEPAKDRTIYTVVALVCMMVLSLLLGMLSITLRTYPPAFHAL